MNKFFKLTSLALLCFSCTDSFDEFSDNVSLKTRAPEEPVSFFDKVTAPERWRQFKTLEEMMEACQLPQQMLDTISTEGLIKLCYDYPLHSIYLAYNNQSEGISVITSNFNGFDELKNRPDAAEKIIDFYDNLYVPVYQTCNNVKYDDFSILKLNYFENILASELIPDIFNTNNKEKLAVAVNKKLQIKQSIPEIYASQSLNSTIKIQRKINSTSENLINTDNISIHSIPLTRSSYDTITVHTFMGTAVEGIITQELTPTEIASLTRQYMVLFPNATCLKPASNLYNCHSYAWNMTDGGDTCWINNNKLSDLTKDCNIKAYWSDQIGYKETFSESTAKKIHYYQSDHSAIKSSVSGYYESKWGQAPLMRHAPEYVPYTNMDKRHLYTFGVNYSKSYILGCNSGVGTTQIGIPSTYVLTEETNLESNYTTRYEWKIENGKGDDVTYSSDVNLNINNQNNTATITFYKLGVFLIYCNCYINNELLAQHTLEALVEP